MTHYGDFTLNGKKFVIFDGGYTTLYGIMFTNIGRKDYYVNKKLLFYELENKSYLLIEIDGNDKMVTNEVMTEVTNFEIETINN